MDKESASTSEVLISIAEKCTQTVEKEESSNPQNILEADIKACKESQGLQSKDKEDSAEEETSLSTCALLPKEPRVRKRERIGEESTMLQDEDEITKLEVYEGKSINDDKELEKQAPKDLDESGIGLDLSEQDSFAISGENLNVTAEIGVNNLSDSALMKTTEERPAEKRVPGDITEDRYNKVTNDEEAETEMPTKLIVDTIHEDDCLLIPTEKDNLDIEAGVRAKHVDDTVCEDDHLAVAKAMKSHELKTNVSAKHVEDTGHEDDNSVVALPKETEDQKAVTGMRAKYVENTVHGDDSSVGPEMTKDQKVETDVCPKHLQDVAQKDVHSAVPEETKDQKVKTGARSKHVQDGVREDDHSVVPKVSKDQKVETGARSKHVKDAVHENDHSVAPEVMRDQRSETGARAKLNSIKEEDEDPDLEGRRQRPKQRRNFRGGRNQGRWGNRNFRNRSNSRKQQEETENTINETIENVEKRDITENEEKNVEKKKSSQRRKKNGQNKKKANSNKEASEKEDLTQNENAELEENKDEETQAQEGKEKKRERFRMRTANPVLKSIARKFQVYSPSVLRPAGKLEVAGYGCFSCYSTEHEKPERWSSNCAWVVFDLKQMSVVRRYKQGCKKCGTMVLPRLQHTSFVEMCYIVVRMYLFRFRHTPQRYAFQEEGQKRATTTHDRNLCERCQELDKPCITEVAKQFLFLYA